MKKDPIYKLAWRYLKTLAHWACTGWRKRDSKTIAYIYDTFCSPCDLLVTEEDGSTWCMCCGCNLHRSDRSIRNKIALANTICAAPEPLWDTNTKTYEPER